MKIPKKQLIRSFYVKYADDYIILTNSTTEYANNLKEKIAHFLKEELKLTLSPKKTNVRNMKIEHPRFLGFQLLAPKKKKNIREAITRTEKKTNLLYRSKSSSTPSLDPKRKYKIRPINSSIIITGDRQRLLS